MSRIDEYLDEVAGRLRLPAARARRLLAEMEAHLDESARAGVDAGLTRDGAEAQAIERFGTPGEVARSAHGSPIAALGALAASLSGLAALACCSVLAATLVAELLARVTSINAFYGLPAGARPSAARVAGWMADQPTAHTWLQAAALENADDTLLMRGAASLLGLVVAAVASRLLRRRFGALPATMTAAIAITAFGGAATTLFFGGVTGSFIAGEWGRGKWLTDAAVAALVTVGYLRLAARRLTT